MRILVRLRQIFQNLIGFVTWPIYFHFLRRENVEIIQVGVAKFIADESRVEALNHSLSFLKKKITFRYTTEFELSTVWYLLRKTDFFYILILLDLSSQYGRRPLIMGLTGFLVQLHTATSKRGFSRVVASEECLFLQMVWSHLSSNGYSGCAIRS